MPKRYIVYLLGLVLLAAIGLYGYYKWQEAQEKVNLWTLVPNDAVLVVETNRHERFIRQLQQTSVGENISRLPYFVNLQETFFLLDSAADRRTTIRDFLSRKRIITSVHVTSKTDFDFIIYLPVSSVAEHRYVRNVIENVSKSALFKTEEEDYQGYLITTIRSESNSAIFTYFTYRNNIILSPTIALLQQVIRKINRARLESPIQEFNKISYLRDRGVYANVFINYQHLAPFLGLFFKPELQPDLDYLTSLCRSSLLGLQLDKQRFYLNGVSQPETLPGSLHQQVGGQKLQSRRLQALTPERTAILIHFGEKQFSNLEQSQKQTTLPVLPAITPLLDSLRQEFAQELALCYLATPNETITPEKIVLAFTPAPAKARNILQIINNTVNANLPIERAGRYRIQEIAVNDLPQQLFGKGFGGFSKCFVAQVDSFMLFAASEESLRGYLQNIRDKKVWSNSEQYQKFLQQNLPEANLNVFFQTNNAWNLLSQYLNEDKKVGLLRYERLIKEFSQVSLQFSQQNKQFNTRFLLQHQLEVNPASQKPEQFKLEQEIVLAAPLIMGPGSLLWQPVSNDEMLVQDSALVLHQVTTAGKITWSDSLDSKLTSAVYSVAIGPDPQLKYVFSTQNRIYCLDQTGADVENFPFNLTDTTIIQNLVVMERGQQNNYYFLVNDDQGNLYLYDRQGNLLPGWDPKEMPGKLAVAPQYLNIKGREVFVFVLENGYAYAVDGNGMNYPGFPINLRGAISSSLITQSGMSFRSSKIILITQAGELITFNLAGQIEKRMAFARPSRRTTFSLIPENSGKSFLVARQDLGRVNLYDANQKLIMEKKYVTSAPKLIQYFYFDPANIVYAITERGPQKTYLYNINIELIGGQPIVNELPVRLEFNALQQQYHLFKASDNTLQELTFRTQP